MNEQQKVEKVYFAASNTGAGFVNYFDSIFSKDDRIYILKGGPGTGKSYLLKAVAEEAERRGYTCERYLCSSDADSLDGVRIPALCISVFDGTAPHSADPKLPGAREDIVNLGAFWDATLLRGERDRIRELGEKKNDAYASALSMLALGAECMRYRLHLLTPYIKRQTMQKAADRFLAKIKAGDQGAVAIPRPMRTYGMKGERRLYTFEQSANSLYCLSSLYGIEYLYLQVLLESAMARGLAVEYSPHPLLPELPEALYFSQHGILISAMLVPEGKKVGTRRFLDSAVLSGRGKLLRFLGKGMHTMIQEALAEFDKMQEYHFALEQIYGKAMDFAKKETFVREFTEGLFAKEKE